MCFLLPLHLQVPQRSYINMWSALLKLHPHMPTPIKFYITWIIEYTYCMFISEINVSLFFQVIHRCLTFNSTMQDCLFITPYAFTCHCCYPQSTVAIYWKEWQALQLIFLFSKSECPFGIPNRHSYLDISEKN